MTLTDQPLNYQLHIAVIGASGAIGTAMVNALSQRHDVAGIYAFSRSDVGFSSSKVKSYFLDIEDESSIIGACTRLKEQNIVLDWILVLTGFLHDGAIMPEKSLRDLSAGKFQKLFAVNTIGPSLVAKHFLPLINREHNSIFAALSARVGSISDNHLGGWYAYRASKAALNMVLKNISIETARSYKKTIVLSLHPGTVESRLSEPFQARVPERKLFTAEYSVQQLLRVIQQRTLKDSGKCFAWDGQEIEY